MRQAAGDDYGRKRRTESTKREAVERKLGIIGEAFVQLREADSLMAERFADLRKIVGMRNRLVHGYDQLDLDVVWDATVNHVPQLLEQVKSVLDAA